jgi:hypothetical protein
VILTTFWISYFFRAVGKIDLRFLDFGVVCTEKLLLMAVSEELSIDLSMVLACLSLLINYFHNILKFSAEIFVFFAGRGDSHSREIKTVTQFKINSTVTDIHR